MTVCKICGKETLTNNKRRNICSEYCRVINKQKIKRAYYEKNREACILRSKQMVQSGYKWNPSEDHRQKIKEKNKKKYRIQKLNNPEKIKEHYTKSNNTEKRKEYMKKYGQNPENKERLKQHRDNYRSKKSTKEIRYTDHLKRRYGITVQDYDMMHMAQNGLCKICNNPETRIFKGKVARLAVDHCHETKKVRGLLCFACNSSIGKFKDDPSLLDSAAKYLRDNGK